MPTGYTHDIPKGIDFKTYAMKCARAFGACVTLREEPGGGENIPVVFEPSDYHAKALQAARDAMAEFLAMTPQQHERAAAKAWDDAETSRLMRLQEKRETRAAYEAMLAKVQAWTPPTAEHAQLHNFMATQIIESIAFDCDEAYCAVPALRRTGSEWAEDRKEMLQRDIEYHDREHAKEVQSAASRTAWVQALRAAL